METITEDYVSFETAKLLKEKGLKVDDETCRRWAVNKQLYEEGHFNESNVAGDYIPIPTLQMAMKWLREVHNIHTEICFYKVNEDDEELKRNRNTPYYTFGVWNTITGDNVDKRLTNDFIGNTYEQACEEAIKYCLENLI